MRSLLTYTFLPPGRNCAFWEKKNVIKDQAFPFFFFSSSHPRHRVSPFSSHTPPSPSPNLVAVFFSSLLSLFLL